MIRLDGALVGSGSRVIYLQVWLPACTMRSVLHCKSSRGCERALCSCLAAGFLQGVDNAMVSVRRHYLFLADKDFETRVQRQGTSV